MSTAEPDSKTYWCHECDMSVSLTPSPSPSPLSCPHCHTNFLELMDSPSAQNDAPSALFDVVFQDALALFSPTPATTTRRAVPSSPPRTLSSPASTRTISKNRRVSVRNWQGRIVVDIREFYVKDGKQMPGKKGISLTMDQWNVLRNHIEEIDKAVNESG